MLIEDKNKLVDKISSEFSTSTIVPWVLLDKVSYGLM
jgi:hypothetical protein